MASGAVELATAACQATEYSQAELLSTLAAAYAEVGDFPAAVDWLQKALERATPELKPQLGEQLLAYQKHEPWREPATRGP